MAIGNILMLLIKPPTAQGGSAISFPHLGITKVVTDADPQAKVVAFLMSPVLKPFAQDQKHALAPASTASAGSQIPCFRQMTAALFRLKFWPATPMEEE